MRTHPALALFAVLALSAHVTHPAYADADGCNDYVPTVVTVQAAFDPTEYDYTLPMMQIKALSDSGKEKGKGSKHSEEWPVGLATGEMYFSINRDIMKMRPTSTQITCGQIKAVQIEFGFRGNKIYVAKEFPKRSCPYREVLAHEEKHKAVDRQLVEEYSEKIKTLFLDVSKKIGVVRNATSAIVDDQIDSAFSQAISKLTKEIETEHVERQKQVDTKEEYQRVTDSCEGQTMEIVNQRLNLLEETRPGSTGRRRSSNY